jgi:hypothetical protein
MDQILSIADPDHHFRRSTGRHWFLELAVPPVSTLWYDIALAAMACGWLGLAVTIRKRYLWAWAIGFTLLALFLPTFETYRHSHAVFSALPVVTAVELPLATCEGPALFAHISDIHAVADNSKFTIDNDPPGNEDCPTSCPRSRATCLPIY